MRIEDSQGFAKFTLVQQFRSPKYIQNTVKKSEKDRLHFEMGEVWAVLFALGHHTRSECFSLSFSALAVREQIYEEPFSSEVF